MTSGPPPRPTIRAVRREDVPAIVALTRETLAEFGLVFGEGTKSDDELLRLPASYEDGGGAFWVAICPTGALLGTCAAYPVAPETYELRKMYLASAARGMGLGQRLLDECIAWIRDRGGKRLVLDTIDAMARAIRFYEANGFARDDAQIRSARCTRGYSREV